MSDDDDLFAVTYTSTQIPALGDENKVDILFSALKARFAHYKKKSVSRQSNDVSGVMNGGPESIVGTHAGSDAVRVSYSGLPESSEGNLITTTSILEKPTSATPAPPIAAHGEKKPQYWEERELYIAAEDLCTYLNGGVNYRLLCKRYQLTLDVILSLIKEDMGLIKTVEVYPQGTCDSALLRLQELLKEAVSLMAENGVKVPEKLVSMINKTIEAPSPNSNDENGVNKEQEKWYPVPRRSTLPGGSVVLGVEPVVLSDTNDKSGIVFTDRQELNPDGSPVAGLLQRPSITESRLQEASPEQGSQLIDFKTYGMQFSVLSSAVDQPLHGAPHPPASTGQPTYSREGGPLSPTPKRTSGPTKEVSQSVVAEMDNTATSTATNDHEDTASDSFDVGNRYSENPVHLIGKERLSKLEALYGEGYHLDGMQLLLDVLGVVFKREYDQGELVTAESAFSSMKRDFQTRVAPALEHNSRSFLLSTSDTTPLRSVYLMECLASRVKPNALLLETLQKFPERDIELLSLTTDPIKDAGLQPLMAVLPKLYRLKQLDLRSCQITDEGVGYLAEGVRYHPSLEKIILSNNDISDQSVPQLLNIIYTVPKLTQLSLGGCPLSEETKKLLNNEVEHPDVHVVYTPKRKRTSSSSAARAESAPPLFSATAPAAPTSQYAAASSGGPRLPHIATHTPVRPSGSAPRRPSDSRGRKVLPSGKRGPSAKPRK